MSELWKLVDLAFIPFAVALFALMPPRRAVMVGLLAGWMFLPVESMAIEKLPDFSKWTVTPFAVLLGMLLLDSRRLLRYRFMWLDVPMLIWLLSSLPSAVSNNIGGSITSAVYGGVSLALDDVFAWGIPYFLGRLYLTEPKHLRELAVAFVMAGLVYVPLCLFEVRMTPQLHRLLYGFHPASFMQTYRLGGYRPTVFMNHGLMVGLFMSFISFVALWLWMGGMSRLGRWLSMVAIVPVLFFVTLLCRSAGAMSLLMLGSMTLCISKFTRMRLFLLGLILIAPTYMTVRASGMWSGEILLETAALVFGEERAYSSLGGRLGNEDMFTERAMQRPLLGWSGWGRFQVRDEDGRLMTTPDGQWVIALGQKGLVGLVSLYLVLLLPAILLYLRLPVRLWWKREWSSTVALSTALVLVAMDSLLNAMIGPAFVLAMGGTTGVLGRVRRAQFKRTEAVAAGQQNEAASNEASARPSSGVYPSGEGQLAR